MLKLTARKFYWKIQHVPETYFKIGYISRKGALNASQELLDLIGKNDFKWENGNTDGGSREIMFCRFKTPAECLSALNMLEFVNPEVINK